MQLPDKQNFAGLVICGGHSSRMGTDKSLLNYHGAPQRYYLYDMLTYLCGRAFISCNAGQAPEIPSTYHIIQDKAPYAGCGPIAGLLSALETHPGTAFLAVGCDYPFLGSKDLQQLLKESDTSDIASAFYNEQEKFYEPLISIYYPGAYPLLKANFEAGEYSLNRFLKDVKAGKIIPGNIDAIQSIDNQDEYHRAMKQIQAKERK